MPPQVLPSQGVRVVLSYRVGAGLELVFRERMNHMFLRVSLRGVLLRWGARLILGRGREAGHFETGRVAGAGSTDSCAFRGKRGGSPLDLSNLPFAHQIRYRRLDGKIAAQNRPAGACTSVSPDSRPSVWLSPEIHSRRAKYPGLPLQFPRRVRARGSFASVLREAPQRTVRRGI